MPSSRASLCVVTGLLISSSLRYYFAMPDPSNPPNEGAMDTSCWLLIAQYAAKVRQLEAALQEKEALAQQQAQLMGQSEEKLRKEADDVERRLLASGHLVPLRELTASMAHELNNPLGIILGFAQERLNDIDPSDPSYRTLQIINEEALRCEMVVRDLLEFARPRTPEFASTDVKEVIAKTLELLARRLEHEKIEARNETDAELPVIDADPQQLQQVLVNLCANSLDAMGPGGILDLAVKLERADALTIVVSDTGFGIDNQHLGKIFQPFFTAKKRRGLGLGLSICDRIVKAHGGSIEVKSRLGEGTKVIIHLPLSRAG